MLVATGEGAGGLGERGEGSRRTDQRLQNSHRDVKYSRGNVVNDTVITLCGVGKYLNYRGTTS